MGIKTRTDLRFAGKTDDELKAHIQALHIRRGQAQEKINKLTRWADALRDEAEVIERELEMRVLDNTDPRPAKRIGRAR